jgi:hypothetical protein
MVIRPNHAFVTGAGNVLEEIRSASQFNLPADQCSAGRNGGKVRLLLQAPLSQRLGSARRFVRRRTDSPDQPRLHRTVSLGRSAQQSRMGSHLRALQTRSTSVNRRRKMVAITEIC